MTRYKIKAKKAINLSGILCTLAVILIGAMLPNVMAELVRDGLRLAVKCVVPTAFPFMVILEYYIFYGKPESLSPLKKIFKLVFGASENALGAYIVGNICGFPLGAKILCDEYSLGHLKKDECEQLLAYCENPSIAFIVGAVGVGMMGSYKLGIILLLLTHLSSMLCGIIYRGKARDLQIVQHNIRQKPSFVEVVRASGRNCIDIASFIAIFSVVCGIIKLCLGNGLLSGIAISITEVTNALNFFTGSYILPSVIRYFLIGFSLGFGGVCVLMQAAIFASKCQLSLVPYIKIKLTQGLICGLLLVLTERICVL